MDMDFLALGLTETHPSHRKAWSGRLRSVVRLDPHLYYGLIKSIINLDYNNDDDDYHNYAALRLCTIL